MGCATSALVGPHRSISKVDQSFLDEQELALLRAPVPKIQVRIGQSVQKYADNNKTAVIFIFGGPGSMKGVMIEELVAAFNFTVLTTEDIVLTYFPNRVATTVQTTQEIKDLIATDPGMLTLEWVLHLMSARITTSNSRLFLIDIVANLHSILRAESFCKPDVRKEMAGFERKHPSLFSINLNVPQLNVSSNPLNAPKTDGSEKPDDEDGGTSATASGNEKDKDKDKEKGKDSSFTGSAADEMDTSRMRKRYDLYLSCAKPFMDYFDEAGRLVTFEVMARQREAVFKKMHDFLREYGFHSTKSSRSVVLFATSDDQVIGLDPLYYRMLKVNLSAIIGSRAESLEQMIKSVYLYVRRSSVSQNHLVILDLLSPKCETQLKRINFLEIRECFLDHYIPYKSSGIGNHNSKTKPFKKPFKAVITTSNEICLFPSELDTETCKKIAACYYLAANGATDTAQHLPKAHLDFSVISSTNSNGVEKRVNSLTETIVTDDL